ncbi:MAG: flagellar biosynthesis protein FlhB [Clostridium sp.]
MAQNSGQEKTEQATPKRRKDARKEGNVFQSRDVSTVVILLGVFFSVRFFLPYMYEQMKTYLIWLLEQSIMNGEDLFTAQLAWETAGVFLKCTLPLLLTALILGVLGQGAQTRFNVSFQSIRPKWSKMNPLTGMKRLFSIKNVIELAKNLIKTSVLLVLLWKVLNSTLTPIARMIDMGLLTSAGYMLQLVFNLVMKVCMVFSVIAFFDFLYQRWEYEKGLRMTKQEVKDEFKQTEGNPQIKGRIRQIQRQMAMSRMMQKVPQADVIIRNPTHVAVALKYDSTRHRAPVVVAKGVDEAALRIVKAGEEHGVYITENKPLARALYSACKLDQEIPAELYGAVAEVLVYLYKLRK